MEPRPSLLFTDSVCGAKPTDRAVYDWAAVVAVYFATRLLVWTFAYTGSLIEFRIAQRLEPPMYQHEERLRSVFQDAGAPETRDFRRLLMDFAPLCRFDGDHYRSIVEGGYLYRPVTPEMTAPQRQQNIAFFPLYPMLAWLAKPLTGGARAGMVLVSHLCSLAAVLVLFHWVRWRIDAATARFAVAITLCLPQSCYYCFGYAESCTLLLTVCTLYLLDRKAELPAAVACGLATATRPTAAALAGVFLIHPMGSRGRGRMRRVLLLLPLALSGIAAYAVYLTIRFGSPWVYFENFRVGWVPDASRADWLEFMTFARVWDQFKHFGRALAAPPASCVELLNPFAWNMVINLAILFISLAGMVRVPRSFRPLLLLGPFIFMQAYLASGGATFGVQPISRYMAVSVSAFVVLAAWCVREWPIGLRHGLLTLLVVLQAAWAFRFGMGEWSS